MDRSHQAADVKDVREKFVETIGVFFQTEGMPRTAGRMLGLLLFDGDPISFGEMATRLQVSRGSISTASRLLLQAGLIQRVSKPGERQDFFQVAEKPYDALVRTEIGRVSYAQGEVSKTINAMPDGHDATCARLHDLRGFFEAMETCLSGVLPKLSQ